MCGIAGWCNLNDNIKDYTNTVKDMIETLRFRGPNSEGIKAYSHAIIGHKRLAIVDPTGGLQPMTKKVGDREYTICYNGELYNTDEVRDTLKEKGYKFNSYSDTEVLLTAYIEYGELCLEYINGIYAFGVWDEYEQELFLARDPLGVKPLFYTYKNGSLIFGSEEKALLAHPMVDHIVDRDGFLELISLGPARSLNSGIFKDIKEVPPAYYLTFDENGINLKEYWKLEAKEHEHNVEETKEYVRNLLVEAI